VLQLLVFGAAITTRQRLLLTGVKVLDAVA
jgi:hypothetical protein